MIRVRHECMHGAATLEVFPTMLTAQQEPILNGPLAYRTHQHGRSYEGPLIPPLQTSG